MRKLTISLFSRAADAHATRQSLTFEELIEDFREPEICEQPADEGVAAALKLEAPAWSPSCYRNDHRAKEDFISASHLVYDLDDVRDVEEVLKKLKALGCVFALHSTTRAGFGPHHKLRLIFPLGKDHDAVLYDALWVEIKGKLGIEPDPTRRHPSGIYFAPIIFAEHKSSYVFECRTQGPYLGQTFSKSLAKRDEKYWLDTIRFASEKHDALNKAAYALAKLMGPEGVADKCLDALRENTTSAPVEDWGHARRTAEKAVEDAATEEVADPLVITTTANEAFVAPGLSRTAERRLMKLSKDIAAGFDIRSSAYELGRFVPHALSAEAVTTKLLEGWDRCKVKTLNKAEAETIIATGIGSGSQNPIGVHDAWKSQLFVANEGVGFAATESNTQQAVTHHPELQGVVAWDVRQDAAVYLAEPPWMDNPPSALPARVEDSTKRELGPWLAREMGINNVSSHVAFEALLSKASGNPHDVLLEYYSALPSATNTDILDRVLIDSAGAEDSLYVRLATRYWFTSVYARQLNPGCKTDHALILSGPQGVGKSTFFRTIFPADIADLCSTEVIPEWDDKDCKIALSRFAVVELAELDQMSKATIEAVKKFLTEARADVRPAFGRVSRSYPRRAVFGGTTNKDSGFLIDTANRRFWPVFVGEFDVGWNEKYRDIVWSQAKYAYENQKRWWPEGEEKKLFSTAQEEVVSLESFHEDIDTILSLPASNKHWTSKGKPADEHMAVLEDEQKLGELLPFISTKQLATILGIDHNNSYQLGRIKRTLEISGWKERRVQRSNTGLFARRWMKK